MEFLGRQYDCKTHTWAFKDGSGKVPDEMRQDVMRACDEKNEFGGNGVPVLATLFEWKKRLGLP